MNHVAEEVASSVQVVSQSKCPPASAMVEEHLASLPYCST
eukprot:CAMPEP_0171093510 /NCGR_PEP_ID=MMETSP0766_2-20121228/39121_1 /TAXON_ID=439317 /ORGANISM="Gambierdiscus australes, Strain CAWD 149" /LENGTH=39 /DNA_ID= /DNA_START= /DNA_END= /DNA_ORIENTATION=